MRSPYWSKARHEKDGVAKRNCINEVLFIPKCKMAVVYDWKGRGSAKEMLVETLGSIKTRRNPKLKYATVLELMLACPGTFYALSLRTTLIEKESFDMVKLYVMR
ncbi:hypothetical protein llap_11543 [Limosa lapponica baueri]|uniref:Uncharacterized protein n=1 Tax=Limosa lapponica baueri TaxID=1758121 RepID=A0A2I0TWH0_LIMLA|nr:hypothetical protein llap_11543 [Limosa lapponica baueri]